eukprot:evm.model.scf_126.2 EVM.evm.TU.scf_126.2   scf_126:18198-19056(+)
MDGYTGWTQIGQGTYGKVYRVFDAAGNPFAIKKTRLKGHDGVPPTTLREVSLLRKLSQGPNIVR